MWNQYYYYDLPKIRVGWACTTKKLSCLCLSENLTPLNQQLAWMCRELKHSGKIHSYWSSNVIVKLRRTMNEWTMSVLNTTQVRDMYPDFIFKEKSSCKQCLLPKWFLLAIYFHNIWVELIYLIFVCVGFENWICVFYK